MAASEILHNSFLCNTKKFSDMIRVFSKETVAYH